MISGFPSLCKLLLVASFNAAMVSAAYLSFYAVIGLMLVGILAIVAPDVAACYAYNLLVAISNI